MCFHVSVDVVKPSPPKPTANATDQPQATMGACDEDSEMDCVGDGTRCVPFEQLCDGSIQCPHGEDEDPRKCAFYNGKCSHISAC